MDKPVERRALRAQTRGGLILSTAVEAFGQRGFAGASLREIASAAGVSLSLLSHHFKSKPGLLAAVVEALRGWCAPHLPDLRSALDRASSPVELIAAWVHYARGAFGHRSGVPFLRLLLRLQSDPEVPQDVRFSLDAAEPHVRRRLKQLFPLATSERIDLAWTASCGALYAALCDSALEGHREPAPGPEISALERYLAGGLLELLSETSLASA